MEYLLIVNHGLIYSKKEFFGVAAIEPLSWGWKFMINLLSEPYSFQASPYLKLSNISLTDVIFLPFLTEFRGSFDVPGQAAAAKLITPAIFAEFR